MVFKKWLLGVLGRRRKETELTEEMWDSWGKETSVELQH